MRFFTLLAAVLAAPAVWAQPTVFTVDATADAVDASAGDGTCADAQGRCTLRAAVDEANATSGDVIINLPGQLAGGRSGSYTLSQVAPNVNDNTYENANQYGDLDVGLQRTGTGQSATTSPAAFTSLAIRGTGTPGPTVTISPNDRVIDLHNGTVTISRVTITGGNSRPGRNGSDAGVAGNDGEDGADGGGVLVRMGVTATLEQVSVNNNKTGSGGNGASPATNGTVGGAAGDGGHGAGIANFGTLTLTKSFVAQNTAGDAGGAANGTAGSGQMVAGGDGGAGGSGAGVFNAGTLTVVQSTVFGNKAGSPSNGADGTNNGASGAEGEGGAGGGIASVNGGTASITGSIVAANTAGDDVQTAKQPGSDLYDGSIADDDANPGANPFSTGSFTDDDYNLIGSNDSVSGVFPADSGPSDTNGDTNIVGSGQQSAASRVSPGITGSNREQTYAVTAYEISASSPAIDAGDPAISEELDGRGFRRPERMATDSNGDQIADIGAFERDSEPVMVPLRIVEFDAVTSPADEQDSAEFIEIRNDGQFTAQLADYVLVLFRGDNGATPEETVVSGPEDTAYFQFNLRGELAPGESYLIGEAMSADVDTSFAVMMASADGFDDDDGAVALFTGKATDYQGAAAGQNAQTRVDVIVYNNGAQASRIAGRRDASSLAGAFGVPQDQIASGDTDDASIQRTSNGGTTTGTPSPGSSNGGTAAGQPGDLVINEIDYDQVGSDTAEFIEILNTGSQPVDLGQVEIRLIQGNSSNANYQMPYRTVTFDPGTTVAANDYYVVCGNTATVPNCDNGDELPSSNAIEQGPDAVELTTTSGTRIDVVSYEGAIPGFSEGSAAPADGNASSFQGQSIQRSPDGRDTDDNGADFALLNATPGAANAGQGTSGPVAQTLDEGEGWYLLAPPVTGLQIDGGASTSTFLDPLWTQGFPGSDAPNGDGNVYRYDESEGVLLDEGYELPGSASDTAEPGRGYFVYTFSDDDPTDGVDDGFPKTLQAEGDEPATPFSFPVTFTDAAPTGSLDNNADGDDDDGWNLVGNPFRSAIDWDNPGWTRTAIEPTAWVYDVENGEYLSYNTNTMTGTGTFDDGEIAVFQGFWIHAVNDNPALEATAQVKIAGTAEFFGRQAVPPAVALRLDATVGGLDRAAFASVAFAESCAAGRDRTCDATDLAPPAATFASLAAVADDGTALDILGLPMDFGREVTIPLDIALVADGVTVGGEATLTWPTLRAVPAEWSVVLRDDATGAEIDLRDATEYTFTLDGPSARTAAGSTGPIALQGPMATAVTDATRFSLLVVNNAVVNTEDEALEPFALSAPAPNPSRADARMTLRLADAQTVRVEMFDALGRRVATLHDGAASAGTLDLAIPSSQLAPGLYVVRAAGEGVTQTRRVTVVR